jgi:hypothetical protein
MKWKLPDFFSYECDHMLTATFFTLANTELTLKPLLNLPIFVTSDCHVVDVLCKIKGWRGWIGLVIECPVVSEAVVVEFCVRNIDPILQRSMEVVSSGHRRNGRRRVTVLVPVDAGLENRPLTLVYR